MRRKRSRVLRNLRRARVVTAARRRRRGRGRRKRRGGLGPLSFSPAVIAAKAALLVIQATVGLLTVGTQLHRRFNGISVRLLEAKNADVVLASLDEQATANAEVLGMVEGDSDWLRAIGRDGKLNSTSRIILDEMKAMALTRARGADMIERDPHFDSPDSLLDKLLMKVDRTGLKDKADEAIRAVRGAGFGKLKSGR